MTNDSEVQNASEVFKDLLEQAENLKEKEIVSRNKIIFLSSYVGRCPRCHTRTKILCQHPYCSQCNWDSLTDPSLGGEKWAA